MRPVQPDRAGTVLARVGWWACRHLSGAGGVFGTVLCGVWVLLGLSRAADVWCSFCLAEPQMLLYAKGLTIGTFF